MPEFRLRAPFEATAAQREAIDRLSAAMARGDRRATLLGVTGSGKTYVMAGVVERLNRPALIVSHNKTLAAQLYGEFKEFFPENAVEYFVSYYDYYQPEAYIPATDTFIEKDAAVNDRIDRLRLAATSSLLSRRDVLVVASVSCIYGLGAPEEYERKVLRIAPGDAMDRDDLLRRLVGMLYRRGEDLRRGTFRVRGETVDLHPSYWEEALRIVFDGDAVASLATLDPVASRPREALVAATVYPAKHYVVGEDALKRALVEIEAELGPRLRDLRAAGKLLEAQRLETRTGLDMEMLRELGVCPGIENYARALSGRAAGEPPHTLLDYFPEDRLVFVDESHVTVPQIGGMYEGDRSRKTTLVEHGFRLPMALDNRPLRGDEFWTRVRQTVFASATPAAFERAEGETVELLVRPTGLVDPAVEVRPARGQVDDLLGEIRAVAAKGERALVTTLTKRSAEELTDYLLDLGLKVRWLHADVETLERIEILRSLRAGQTDVVVGVNLLREGLDLPEVSLVAILDADREGFLRSETSLVQTMGRAARHAAGRVLLYADAPTDSMRRAMEETARRRAVQVAYNEAHGIIPRGIVKPIRAPAVFSEPLAADVVRDVRLDPAAVAPDEKARIVEALTREMDEAADRLDFEGAAALRDRIEEISGLTSGGRRRSLGAARGGKSSRR